MKSKYKYEKPKCPICYDNKNVVSDRNGSASGMCGIASKGVIGSGSSHSYLYCTKCFVDFEITITYKKYVKDKRTMTNE